MKVTLELQVPDELCEVAGLCNQEQYERIIREAYTDALERVEAYAADYVKGHKIKWLVLDEDDGVEDKEYVVNQARKYVEELEALKKVIPAYQALSKLEVSIVE